MFDPDLASTPDSAGESMKGIGATLPQSTRANPVFSPFHNPPEPQVAFLPQPLLAHFRLAASPFRPGATLFSAARPSHETGHCRAFIRGRNLRHRHAFPSLAGPHSAFLAPHMARARYMGQSQCRPPLAGSSRRIRRTTPLRQAPMTEAALQRQHDIKGTSRPKSAGEIGGASQAAQAKLFRFCRVILMRGRAPLKGSCSTRPASLDRGEPLKRGTT